MSINVEYNIKERNTIIIINLFKMLEKRRVIKSWESEYKKIDPTQLIIDFNTPEGKYSFNIINLRFL